MNVAVEHDVIVVGSGFGGSVSALRLTEKGYRVAVIEAGRRWTPDTLPTTNYDVRRFLWFPKLGMRGFQRLTLLRNVFILSGVAVGGGSVVYANTLYRPLAAYWDDPRWAHLTDWRDELLPHYDQAERMLGATPTPFETNADHVLTEVGRRLGVEDTFHPTNVGVWFGEPGERVADPYFGGEGPDRVGCIRCGGCMVGCRFEAKNTLDANYLHLAEKNGAEVLAEREVVDLERCDDGTWQVTTERPGAWVRKERRTHSARHVIFSAGALGTMKLLFQLRDDGRLPEVSPLLGTLTRTNSEALVGATARSSAIDYSEGIAITSSIHPDEHTHIEPVRYPRGSNVMGFLATMMVDDGGRIPRWLRFVVTILMHPVRFLRSLSVRRWAERSIVLLVMQSLDNSLETFRKRGLFGWKLSTRQGHGEPNPTWIPIANRAAREAAEVMGGDPLGSIFEATMNVPATAHIIGGCPIGETAEEGVVDPFHRLHGYDGLHVVDGSTITANLGVNPSLTITAMAERALSFWPNRGEDDPRPPLGSGYRRVEPVPPDHPAVPDGAPAALRKPDRGDG